MNKLIVLLFLFLMSININSTVQFIRNFNNNRYSLRITWYVCKHLLSRSQFVKVHKQTTFQLQTSYYRESIHLQHSLTKRSLRNQHHSSTHYQQPMNTRPQFNTLAHMYTPVKLHRAKLQYIATYSIYHTYVSMYTSAPLCTYRTLDNLWLPLTDRDHRARLLVRRHTNYPLMVLLLNCYQLKKIAQGKEQLRRTWSSPLPFVSTIRLMALAICAPARAHTDTHTHYTFKHTQMHAHMRTCTHTNTHRVYVISLPVGPLH